MQLVDNGREYADTFDCGDVAPLFDAYREGLGFCALILTTSRFAEAHRVLDFGSLRPLSFRRLPANDKNRAFENSGYKKVRSLRTSKSFL